LWLVHVCVRGGGLRILVRGIGGVFIACISLYLLIVVVMRWGGAQSRVVVSHKRVIAGDAVVPALLANGLARLR
jgi:hypothetical protein